MRPKENWWILPALGRVDLDREPAKSLAEQSEQWQREGVPETWRASRSALESQMRRLDPVRYPRWTPWVASVVFLVLVALALWEW